MSLVIINNDISTNIAIGDLSIVNVGLAVIVLIGLRRVRTRKLLLRLLLTLGRAFIAAVASWRGKRAERASVWTFRFLTGIAVRTEAEIENLIRWAAEHDESLEDINATGHYFDVGAPGLRTNMALPGKWMRALGALILSLAVTLGTASATRAFSDKTILKSNRTGAMLTLEGRMAKSIGGGWEFNLNACGSQGVRATGAIGPAASEVDGLCRAFASPSFTQNFVRSALLSQRVVFTSIAALLIFTAWALASWLKRAASALAMNKRLKS